MPEPRNERRKARYRFLRELGFSPTVAARLRDRSGRNIENEIKRERRKITRKPIRRRTAEERERLNQIELSTSRTLLETRQRRFMSRGERWENFSQWSSTGFPPWAITRIRQYNRTRRLAREDSFGYRRFYYWYVERIADFENEIFADRGDSGIRHMRGIPLKSNVSARRIA